MPRALLLLTLAKVYCLDHLDHGLEGVLVRRHEAAVNFAGETRQSFSARKEARHAQIHAVFQAASPAVPSTGDPADADDVAGAPAPAVLVSASSAAEDAKRFAERLERRAPAPPLAPKAKVNGANGANGANGHGHANHRARHRLSVTSLALLMLLSGCLGLLVVWRQAKVLRHPRHEDEARAKRPLRRSSTNSPDLAAQDPPVLATEEAMQASSSQRASLDELKIRRSQDLADAAPEVAEKLQDPHDHDSEADAAGGGIRKN
ncbi:unnamed protein product [Effrenium voratum]|uniref:Transmembrane protein n=1 Tax=Effrenium voratum TaxID=2562239 RepID=A0AA36J358_9DINO|nr:unnamed protein product [Effrenium voratum]CAJ1418708.1 unnamed protein product [Effrenium voratum]